MDKQLDLTECGKHAVDLNVVDSKGQITGSNESTPISSIKEGHVGRHHPKLNFASVTPEKSSETSHVNCVKEAGLLPHNYRTLLDFLDRMASSLRLLALCKKPPTFHNISRQVEIFTGRKFEYKHIAQIKHVLPEAVKIDKILVHNAETLCMNPEIKITMNFDIVEGCHEESVFIALHHLFVSRLQNFLDKHSEACDIPEAVLPVTYNQRDVTISTDPLPGDVSTSTRTEAIKSSHFSPTYAPRFAERAIGDVSERMRLNTVPIRSSYWVTGDEIATERITSDSCSKPTFNRDPVGSSPQHVSSSTFRSTPLKFVSESENLMLETPAQSTPKRSSSTSEGKHKTLITETCMSCNQTAKRSLDFSKLDEEEIALNLTPCEIDQTKTFPNPSTQMEIKGKKVSASSISREDEISICYNGKGDKISQYCLPAHQQTSICLSELAISIQKIFQSVNRRAMTKEELFHKIIMNCEFDEKGQIEEQIEILEKLVPGWICKKLVPSGDLLYCIEKVPDFNSIIERVSII